MNPTTTVFSIDYEARGIARPEGKTTFIRHALPQEKVRYRIAATKAAFDEADVLEILQPSPERRPAACPHYLECGGCALQHASFDAQVAFKQRIFEEQLERIGRLRPETILPPVYGRPWHYRSRTRLNTADDGRGGLLLGYQAKRSRRIVAIDSCPVLPEQVSGSLTDLNAALQKLHRAAPAAGIEALEICAGEGATAVNVRSRRVLPETALAAFSGCLPAGWQLWRQHGRNPPQPWSADAPPLAYRLPEFGLTMPFRPGDFTQINLPLNRLMVSRALSLLDVRPHETVIDLFCGLGNFSLPLARQAARVLGVEGSRELVRRAADNARANGISNARFVCADLFDTDESVVKSWGRADKMLIDPPRAGAYAMVRSLHAPFLPQKIVYVSCNPATFARDAAVLAAKGYRLRSAGIVNMFPQTAHVEAVSLFELG